MKKKSNKPTKTKSKMKKTMRFLSMAALALVGAMMTGCTNDDNIIDEPQQPASKNNIVTMTTTVSLDGGAQTRALTSGGVKTFAEGEQIALVYKNTSSATVKAVSAALADGDITNEGKSATFTFELTDPDKTQNVTYIYPAAMAKADGTVNYDALATQNGTLATLSSTLDLATYSAAWNAGSLPAATLDNQLAILTLTLKNSDGTSDITSSITGVTLSDGTNSYAVTRSAAAGPIYVAIRPTTSADITVTATDGTNNYSKSLTGKTYAASNGYSVSWRMTQVYPFTINNGGKKVVFAPGNLQYNASESTYKWRFAENQYDAIGAWDASSWIDLFGWGTWTGSSPNPTNTSTTNSDYSWNSDDFTQESSLADASLRSYNWRTLTSGSGGEWVWILGPSSSPTPGTNCRTSSTVNGTANARFARATVVGKSGIIIFPDTYTHPSDVTQPSSINTTNAAFTVNSYDATAWGKMETAGCVFLPATGYRNGTSVYNVGSYGNYWSSKVGNGDVAYNVYFLSSNLNPAYFSNRIYGFSVRLVRDAQ